MTDEFKGGAVQQTEPGQVQPQGEPQTPPAGGTQPETLTKADLETFAKTLRQDLLHVIRSQTVEAESKIKKEVEAKLSQVETNFKQMKEAGISVTDDDLKVARSLAISEATKSLPASSPDAQSGSSEAIDPQEQAVIDKTNAAMVALQEQYGYVIGPSDPEFRKIVWKDIPPEDFLKNYKEQLVKINTRLGRPLPRESTIPATARIPLSGGGVPAPDNEIADIKDPHELLKMGLKQLRK